MKTNIQHTENFSGVTNGGKANNLKKLSDLVGNKVPKWLVIPAEVLLSQLPENIAVENCQSEFEKLQVSDEILKEIEAFFGADFQGKTYAVRSSALDEDGAKFSFAGQFDTFLHVSPAHLAERIKQVWCSVANENVLVYRKQNNLPMQFGIAVIVQEMVAADTAGVAFGLNPVNGNKQEKVISAVYGLGEGLVSGELDADNYIKSAKEIQSQLAHKTHAFKLDPTTNLVAKMPLPAKMHSASSLSEVQVNEIAALLDLLEGKIGSPQDVEFAYKNEALFLLQTRPITNISEQPKPEGEYILWDNSNIIESYPGITTPLTYSFILKMYEFVYRQFCGLMGVREEQIEKHAEVFANTLGLVRGRVYYNLLHWYKMLAMVPGYSLNAEFMENMMGVKERFELKEDFGMGKGLARVRVVGMIFKMFRLQAGISKERDRFMQHLNGVMAKYHAMAFDAMDTAEVVDAYRKFETSLLLEWKAPLINDFFAMIWFGMLQKQTTKFLPDQPNIHNDLMCGSQDIISVQPIHMTVAIAKLIAQDKAANELFVSSESLAIWNALCEGKYPKIKKEIDDYILKFGERCIGELKLESISYSQQPELFVGVVKSYVEQKIFEKTSHGNLEEELRNNAEKAIFAQLKGKPLKKWWFKKVLGKARDLVSNRENLRYERTRGFGMVRRMFSALGKKWEAAGVLENHRDVFYLELEEIKEARGGVLPEKIKETINERKAEFEAYRRQKPPEERFFSYGNDFSDKYIYSTEKIELTDGDLQGIGCCPGRVQGRIVKVMDPREISSLKGDILVTSSTDPGWVTLFPTASAIIVERGSLLSHSAIVSREMGIPCIVSVSGLLRRLETGDEVIMDGSTGVIKVLENE